MKLEHGSFTAAGSINTPILNDSSLTPDRVVFWVEGTHPSHGYDNLTEHVAAYGNATDTTDDYSIYVHNGSTELVAGKITQVYTGEFDVTFDTLTGAPTINFLAIQD